MTERVSFHCLNCGLDFEAEALTNAEIEELRRKFRQGAPIRCPRCRHTDLRREGLRRTG